MKWSIRFIMATAEEPIVPENIAADLEISESEARFILSYLIDHDIMKFRKI